MQIRLEIVLVGLAISFASPTFAQEKNAAVDPQIVQQLQAIGKKSDEAFLKGDATSLAALFTQDAVLVTDRGPVYGRQASGRIVLPDNPSHIRSSTGFLASDRRP
jgi:type II secretory pathway pseudopilin PulG